MTIDCVPKCSRDDLRQGFRAFWRLDGKDNWHDGTRAYFEKASELIAIPGLVVHVIDAKTFEVIRSNVTDLRDLVFLTNYINEKLRKQK